MGQIKCTNQDKECLGWQSKTLNGNEEYGGVSHSMLVLLCTWKTGHISMI